LNSNLFYINILIASIAGPLALSFDKKVAYHKKWKQVFMAMMIPAFIYLLWDLLFTYWGVWSFNQDYITGYKLINLPIEEVLFFFVVPFCCLFIYECIKQYFPTMSDGKWAVPFCYILALMLLVLGIAHLHQVYTSWTFIGNAVFLSCLPFLKKKFAFIHLQRMWVSYAIILLPFLLVNGFLTAIPVVCYNDAENLGIRLYTIPAEDIFYGMLLIFADILLYERLIQPRV
jgi:lycopene cyclase domain-containing protein